MPKRVEQISARALDALKDDGKYAVGGVVGLYLHVSAIDNDHLLQILRPMWSAKTETATRLRGRIECILDWAAHRGYRARKNPAQWEGNLKHELPSPTKLKKRKKQHFPALPYLRVGAFMADLRSRQGVSVRALEWGILNAARSQEIRGTRPMSGKADQGIWIQFRTALPPHMAFARRFATGQRKLPSSRAK